MDATTGAAVKLLMAFHSFRTPSKALVWLLLLALAMGSGGNGFDARLLAHELDHMSQPQGASPDDHDHAHNLAANAGAESAPMENAEHQFLHFACHLQPLLASSFPDRINPVPAREPPLRPHSLALPSVALETLFRPPRKIVRT